MLSQQQVKIRRKYPKSLRRQQGVVIIVALFIVALVATMSYFMMSRLERDTRRTSLVLHAAQAESYAQGSIAWAIDQLRNNWERKKPTGAVDQLPIVSGLIDMNGYKIRSTIYDAQDRFNLNNVASKEGQKDFTRLIKLLNPEFNDEKIQEIIAALTDWISPAITKTEFSKYYLELPVPYSPAHQNMISVNELLLIKGMTSKLFLTLKPYVIALPESTPINITTASAVVLSTLSEKIVSLDTGRAIERDRREKPYNTVEDFLKRDFAKNFTIAQGKIDVTSDYFVVETEVRIDNQHVVLYTLLKRGKNDSKTDINIIWQSKNTF